jgi:hypothetical protein
MRGLTLPLTLPKSVSRPTLAIAVGPSRGGRSAPLQTSST